MTMTECPMCCGDGVVCKEDMIDEEDQIATLTAQLTASQQALAVSLRAERETLDVLRAYAAHTHLSHCGSCCLCAPGGGVIVDEASCVCHPEDKAVMRLFGMFDETDRARTTTADLAQGKAGSDEG